LLVGGFSFAKDRPARIGGPVFSFVIAAAIGLNSTNKHVALQHTRIPQVWRQKSGARAQTRCPFICFDGMLKINSA